MSLCPKTHYIYCIIIFFYILNFILCFIVKGHVVVSVDDSQTG